MRLTVISDGTPRGTHIVHAGSGERLLGILWHELRQESGDLQVLTVQVQIKQPPEPVNRTSPDGPSPGLGPDLPDPATKRATP